MVCFAITQLDRLNVSFANQGIEIDESRHENAVALRDQFKAHFEEFANRPFQFEVDLICGDFLQHADQVCPTFAVRWFTIM